MQVDAVRQCVQLSFQEHLQKWFFHLKAQETNEGVRACRQEQQAPRWNLVLHQGSVEDLHQSACSILVAITLAQASKHVMADPVHILFRHVAHAPICFISVNCRAKVKGLPDKFKAVILICFDVYEALLQSTCTLVGVDSSQTVTMQQQQCSTVQSSTISTATRTPGPWFDGTHRSVS